MTGDDLAALRARLLQLRRDAHRQLAAADQIDTGLLAIVAHAGAALTARDDQEDDDADRA